jgi:outer membrane protein OmpA-like peptidoglycan-associated protein
MKMSFFYTLASFLFALSLKAQSNLILNPSVESAAYNQPQSWILFGSVDYFRNQSLQTSGVRSVDEPQYPEPVSAQNYLGIRAFEAGSEIAVARFTQPMIRDQWYRISCFSRTSAIDCASDLRGISVYPSDSILKTKYWYGARPQIPFIDLQPIEKSSLVSSLEWTEVFAYFQSRGGEKFLWVGDFNYTNDATPHTNEALMNAKDVLKCITHFYCDSFVVQKCLPPDLTRLTIHNITFNSGSYAITSVDDPNMQYLVKYLNDFPSIHLKVGGHTDNEGSEQFNLDLSRKRADAVKTWLVEQGIETARISTTGFGKNKPLAPQKTAEQKALNRRVELTLYENN